MPTVVALFRLHLLSRERCSPYCYRRIYSKVHRTSMGPVGDRTSDGNCSSRSVTVQCGVWPGGVTDLGPISQKHCEGTVSH